MLRILASGALLAGTLPAAAQRSLVTPRGTGAPALRRSAMLPIARDLAADARESTARRAPILLFFDREECPYCERALREYLVPMSQESWKDRALFRQIEMDTALPVVAFDGTATTHRALAERYGVALSPTVLIVGPGGERLAGPLVGLMTVDFYGAYLDSALAEAAGKLSR